MRNSIVHVADTVNIRKGSDDLTCYRFNNVVNEQGLPMAVFENKNRTFNKAI
jgi:hypothetical protein